MTSLIRPSAAVVLALALTWGVARAQPAARPAPPAQPSNTVAARRFLRLTQEPSPVQADLTAVMARLYSAEEAGAVASQVLGIPAQAALAAIQPVDPYGHKSGGTGIEFHVDLNQLDAAHRQAARPAAKELADRLAKRLEELLAEDRDQQTRPMLMAAHEQADRAAREYEELFARYRSAQEKMTALAGRADASPESMRAALTKLEDERQRLELDMAGMEARQQAVEERIARTADKLAARAKDDPVVAELQKALQAHERLVDLARKRFESGQATEAAVAEAETKLSDVRISLLDRQRGAGGDGASGEGAASLAALNRELQNLSIELIDRKARLQYVQKRLGPLQEAAQLIPNVEAAGAELPRSRKELDEARQQRREAQRVSGSANRDRLILLSAENTPAGAKKATDEEKQDR